VPTPPIPVLGGDAERLSQVVESGVQFCHGANLGSYHTRCGGERSACAIDLATGLIRLGQTDT
jgi:hypothetical protein